LGSEIMGFSEIFSIVVWAAIASLIFPGFVYMTPVKLVVDLSGLSQTTCDSFKINTVTGGEGVLVPIPADEMQTQTQTTPDVIDNVSMTTIYLIAGAFLIGLLIFFFKIFDDKGKLTKLLTIAFLGKKKKKVDDKNKKSVN